MVPRNADRTPADLTSPLRRIPGENQSAASVLGRAQRWPWRGRTYQNVALPRRPRGRKGRGRGDTLAPRGRPREHRRSGGAQAAEANGDAGWRWLSRRPVRPGEGGSPWTLIWLLSHGRDPGRPSLVLSLMLTVGVQRPSTPCSPDGGQWAGTCVPPGALWHERVCVCDRPAQTGAQ